MNKKKPSKYTVEELRALAEKYKVTDYAHWREVAMSQQVFCMNLIEKERKVPYLHEEGELDREN